MILNENVQRFLKVLKKCDSSLVSERDNGLYSEYFDINEKRLKIDTLNCLNLLEHELNDLNILRHVDGDLLISLDDIEQLNSFNYLRSVKKLYIKDMQNLKEINGFNALKEISALEISNNKSLEEINGFNVLFKYKHSIESSIKIIKNTKLQSVEFLKGIKEVGSSFYLHKNNLPTLKGLENLERVKASFSCSSNGLKDISALKNLKYINGILNLAYNKLSSLKGLENLIFIKTTLWNGENKTINIQSNNNLTDISALKNILTNERYIILWIDNYTQYKIKPHPNSDFHKNILELYENKTKSFIPTYNFVNKEKHNYEYFGKATHSTRLKHIFDFEVKTDILVISFSGFNGWLGGVFNSRYPFIINQMNTNKIFIMDEYNAWYHNGFKGIAPNIDAIVEIINNFIKQGKYKKILCIGASMGGYMALLIGKLIHATNILALSPQTFLDKKNREKYNDNRWAKNISSLNKENEPYLDLALLYEKLDNDIKVEIHYSDNVLLDKIHANHLNNVTKIGYKDSDHYLAVYLHKKNMLEKLILDNLEITKENPKILFGDKWQKATQKCNWLDPYHINFKNIKNVIKYAKTNDIKVFFANNYTTQIEILKHEKILKENGFKFIINTKNTLKSFVNKQKFYDIMVKNGMQKYVAKHYDFEDDIKYPCVVKTKTGGAGRGVFLAYNRKEIGKIDKNIIISEYLPSNTEYATSIFYKNGKIIKDITFSKTIKKEAYILQQENKNNIEVKREPTQFLDIFKNIIELINTKYGFVQCSVNYKIEENIPKIFEINPRIGYTLAGFSDDFKEMIDIYLQEINNL